MGPVGKLARPRWEFKPRGESGNDFNATVLHLMGFDHERTTSYHYGIERRLTDAHGQVLEDVLACIFDSSHHAPRDERSQ